jgi:hypothetical protein
MSDGKAIAELAISLDNGTYSVRSQAIKIC